MCFFCKKIIVYLEGPSRHFLDFCPSVNGQHRHQGGAEALSSETIGSQMTWMMEVVVYHSSSSSLNQTKRCFEVLLLLSSTSGGCRQ